MTSELGDSVYIKDLGRGRFSIQSDLTFDTATTILAESKALFAPHDHIDIDMINVRRADSAGLALLLEWLSWAQSVDREISYQNLPPQILAIAEISEVAGLLVPQERG